MWGRWVGRLLSGSRPCPQWLADLMQRSTSSGEVAHAAVAYRYTPLPPGQTGRQQEVGACDMQTNLTIIESAIANALNSTPFSERNGRALEQVVEDSIDPERFKVDPQDTKRFLGASLPVWRDGERGEIFTPRRHSAMDLVVYDGGHRAVALVEIESNLEPNPIILYRPDNHRI